MSVQHEDGKLSIATTAIVALSVCEWMCANIILQL